MKSIIQIENISKKYRIGGNVVPYQSLRESIVEMFKFKGSQKKSFWALSDVSFDVQSGESVAIIGSNGAGKSTLLKILSKITLPTKGCITMRGRVASLLEVGTGFHGELTGRENIYLNGSILGLRKAEITEKFDQIVDFSGVENFIDTPLKHFSSGMSLRLAFSVAAHLEPEILIIDEVLAVGDAAFQKKCLGKMKEVANQGRTVLFVSHNMSAVKTLCSRGVVLEKGQLAFSGAIDQAVSHYLGANQESGYEISRTEKNAPGNKDVRLFYAGVKAVGKEMGEPISTEDDIEVTIRIQQMKNVRLDTTLQFVDEEGNVLFTTWSGNVEEVCGDQSGCNWIQTKCYIPGNFFNSGTLSVNLHVVEDLRIMNHQFGTILSFMIIEGTAKIGQWMGRPAGVLKPNLEWERKVGQA